MPSIKKKDEFECPRLNSYPNGMWKKFLFWDFKRRIKKSPCIKISLIEYDDKSKEIKCVKGGGNTKEGPLETTCFCCYEKKSSPCLYKNFLK